MGRTRKGMVVESSEELESLLGHFSASPNEARVRFLLALKDDPRVKSEALVGVLGLSDRTIRRWWNEYNTSGISVFLDHTALTPAVAEDTNEYKDSSWPALMVLLNSLPAGCDMVEWRAEVESALANFLEGIDRVDLLIPALEDNASSPVGERSNPHFDNVRVLELAIGDDAALGMLRLHAVAGMGFDTALSTLDELRPFLAFLVTDAVARSRAANEQRNTSPTDFLTGALVKSLSPRERDILVHRLYGYSYSDTALRLGVSQETVRKCVKSIYRKTNTTSMGELFVRYFGSVDNESEW